YSDSYRQYSRALESQKLGGFSYSPPTPPCRTPCYGGGPRAADWPMAHQRSAIWHMSTVSLLRELQMLRVLVDFGADSPVLTAVYEQGEAMGDLRETCAWLHTQGHQWLKCEAELVGMVLWAVGITTLAWLPNMGVLTPVYPSVFVGLKVVAAWLW